MRGKTRTRRGAFRALALAGALVGAPPLPAEEHPPAPAGHYRMGTALQSRGGQPDFRFSAPRGSFAIRAGWSFAGAGSDVFDFVVEQLTVERGDFDSPVIGGEFAWQIGPRLAVLGRAEFGRARITSEFRDFVDQDDQPITQETRFARAPITAAVKLFLVPRGAGVSRFAWVPNRVVPWVGAGVGAVWYNFEQFGDFVDFDDLGVFTETFESSGWTGTGEVFAGVNVNLRPNLSLVLEARYGWARATLGGDFEGFDPIDLSGLSTTVGVDVVF